MSELPRLFHLHIRKTAGTALLYSLKPLYRPEQICPYRSDLEFFAKTTPANRGEFFDRYSLISGHFYKVAALVPPTFQSIVVLRDPVRRLISAYNHMVADERDLSHEQIKCLALGEAIRDDRFKHELWNGMTRALTDAAGLDFDDLTDRQRIEGCLAYLRKCALVGFQENLAVFREGVKALVGFALSPERRVNDRITQDGIGTDALYDIIPEFAQRNRLDLLLYSEARSEFLLPSLNASA